VYCGHGAGTRKFLHSTVKPRSCLLWLLAEKGLEICWVMGFLRRLLLPQLAQEVDALRVKHLSAANERDKKIDSLEDRILARLSELVDTVYKPQQLTSMFAVLNRAVRRGQPAHESVIVAQQIVNLTIPAAATRNFIVNQAGEVVQIGDQTMVTMPTHELLRKLSSEATSAQASKRYAHVSNYLPSAAREIGVDDV